jgi:hypothetical protein
MKQNKQSANPTGFHIPACIAAVHNYWKVLKNRLVKAGPEHMQFMAFHDFHVLEIETPPPGRRRADDTLIGGVNVSKIMYGSHPVKEARENRCNA